MADTSVIKEFLISLGFRQDKAGLQNMQKGMASVTAGAVALGEIIADTAEQVARATVKMAMSLDELYFTSRRVNAAGENIKAFGFAIEQLGGTAQGAQAALEGIASFMRSNPGGERFIQGLGVVTRDAQGNLRDTEKVAEDLGKHFSQIPFYVAKAQAAVLGIGDDKTLLAMIQGPGEEADKYRDFAARLGLGMDAGADASNRFGEKVRDLKAEFGLLFIAGTEQLLPMFQQFVDWLSKLPLYIDQFKRSRLGEEFTKIWNELKPLLAAIVDLAKVLWDDLGPTVKAIVSGSLTLLSDTLVLITDSLRTITDILRGDWKAAWKDGVKAAQDSANLIADSVRASLHAAHQLWEGDQAKVPAQDDLFNGIGGNVRNHGTLGAPGTNLEGRTGSAPIAGNNGSGGIRGAVYSFLQSHGIKAYQAWGISAGVKAEGGGVGMAANGAFGIGQWRGPRLRELFARYGNHPTLAQQMQFLLWELNGGDKGGASVRSQNSAAGAMVSYLRDFMRPGPGLGGDLRRGAAALASPGGANVAMSQRTDINIHGVTDPKAAGNVVAASQTRVNGNMIRNLKTAWA